MLNFRHPKFQIGHLFRLENQPRGRAHMRNLITAEYSPKKANGGATTKNFVVRVDNALMAWSKGRTHYILYLGVNFYLDSALDTFAGWCCEVGYFVVVDDLELDETMKWVLLSLQLM
ncbi:hypothetical protein C5167_041716, partial [Papaver somniferum]